MPCKVCNCTIQEVSESFWWCPRCGTLHTIRGEFNEHEAPRWTKLISEARHGIAFNEYQTAQQHIQQEKQHGTVQRL